MITRQLRSFDARIALTYVGKHCFLLFGRVGICDVLPMVSFRITASSFETGASYLIEPRLHDLCRLLRQIAALSCLALLVVVVAGHEECRLRFLVTHYLGVRIVLLQPVTIDVVRMLARVRFISQRKRIVRRARRWVGTVCRLDWVWRNKVTVTHDR